MVAFNVLPDTATVERHFGHVNINVSEPDRTVIWMRDVFEWPVRWQEAAAGEGRSLQVGELRRHGALYCSNEPAVAATDSFIADWV